MTAENSPALRNASLIIRYVGIELGTRTKINKFWTSSSKRHARHHPSPRGVLAKFPKNIHQLWVLGIDMGHYMTIVQASGIK